ncbi:hypothetical protein BCR35DRAFT_303248 [Leucosporidium creatinivorum]|uniref:Uncharacterized protein n=1 Tax=Leucosporidium creatinivorum TaxID=106004 RepID=A0A1Y2FJM3_9BASI|nr:hypothetical protein BCR35DRAFT_303248 [Leucosporidium creatinivorum]
MQFPRSKRFVAPTNTDIPPVGAYDVPLGLPDPTYKRGAMLEKAGRFIEKEGGPDTFGLYDPESKENKRPRASSGLASIGAAERARQQMDDLKHRLQIQHEKETAKLVVKITRLEAARDESVREKGETAKELLSLKAEVRTLTSRETSLTSKLTKTEASLSKHVATVPLLQSKLEELTKSHDSSRKRRDLEIAELKSTLERREESIAELEGEVRRWKREAREEGRARKDVTEATERVVKDLRTQVASVRVVDLTAASLRIARLERQLEDRTAQVQALGEYSAQVGEEADALKEELVQAEEERDWALGEWRKEREDRRSEKEWRQRARSDQREMVGLREEVAFLEGWVRFGREVERDSKWVEEERREEMSRTLGRLEKELEVAEGELDLAVNEEIPVLEEQVDALTEERDEVRERASELHEALAVAEGDVQELQERAVIELERFEGEMEEQKRKVVDKEKEVEKERSEKKRVAGLLGQSRAAQDGLREELDLALARIADLEQVGSQHKDLCRTLDQLARQNAATELDNRQLAEQNTELISHGNPHQKIRHVAQIREELAESRRRHLSTTSTLASAESEVAALRAELEAYRSISPLPTTTLMGPPSTIPARSRVSRPILDDVFTPSVSARPAPPATVAAPGRSVSSSQVPRFVIHEQAEEEEEEDPDRIFAPSDHPSALQSSAAPAFGRSVASSIGIGSRKAGRASQVHQPMMGREKERSVSSPAVRMSGRMTVDELFE